MRYANCCTLQEGRPRAKATGKVRLKPKPTVSVFKVGPRHLTIREAATELLLDLFRNDRGIGDRSITATERLYASLLIASMVESEPNLHELFERELHKYRIMVEWPEEGPW